jgi:hypothetical protein
MVKTPFSKHLVRALGLIALGCALFIAAPANRLSSPSQVTSPAVSPTPTPTPEIKPPNPVRRFFSSVFDGITGVFRRRPNGVGCSLPPHVFLTSSSSLIMSCPVGQQSLTQTCFTSTEVTLTADAPDPNGDELLFTWSVTAGRLRGEGRTVTWNLGAVPAGTYTASVEVNDGTGLTANSATSVTVASCSDCGFVVLPCPNVSVSCPSSVESKQPMTFVATVSGGDPSITPTYQWELSAGKITSGQGRSKVVVDVSDLTGQSLTGTVTVGGFNPLCSKVASCTILHVSH